MFTRQALSVSALLLATFAPPPILAGELAADRPGLAASIDRRERELAARSPQELIEEVRERARALAVEAPAEELAPLLRRKARLEIAADRCELRGGGAGCDGLAVELAVVERRFVRLAGLSSDEFERGRRRGPDGARGTVPGAPRPGVSSGPRPIFEAEGNDGFHCVCDITVYSRDRWMNRWWALECNGHGGHGVCSGNVDSFHSAGTGAMTGLITVYFGRWGYQFECPDDHTTCFRGPSTAHPGQWGNVCSCDTWDSQFWNPFGDWYGGDLTHAPEIQQVRLQQALGDGECGANAVGVKEYIEENDPGCCDDPMGDLIAWVGVADGQLSQSVPVSAQNCNGGSQSGVSPYCGTFGATLRIATSCQTREDTPFASCQGYCWGVPPDGACSCEPGCYSQGTCCPDYGEVCCDPNQVYNGCYR